MTRVLPAAALALALAVCLAPRASSALDGQPCRHTPECNESAHELCIADALTSTAGTCRKVKNLS